MSRDSSFKQSNGLRNQAAFTLVELMITVAIVGMLASIAIPMLQEAMMRSKRNSASSDLRVLRDAIHQYAVDEGAYPDWGELDFASLKPLVPGHLQSSKMVLKNLEGSRIDLYIPFDPFAGGEFAFPGNANGFLILATLDYKQSLRLIITDSAAYYWTPEEGLVEAG